MNAFEYGFFNELEKIAAQLADHHALPDVVDNFDDFAITKQRTQTGYPAGVSFHAGRPIIHAIDRAGRGNWFYQSQHGTSGKQKGMWYPTGGVVTAGPDPGAAGWIIKGSPEKDRGYGRPDLARLGNSINERLPTDPDDLAEFFKRLSGDKDRLTPEELRAKSAFQKRVYAHTTEHPYNHAQWLFKHWENRHLNPVWGPRVDQHTKLGFFNELEKLAAKGVATKTNPSLWARAKAQAKARMGGKHSARAMQLATKIYKKGGGGYSGRKPSASSNKMVKWTKQKWRTRPGTGRIAKKESGRTSRYLPEKKWHSLSKSEQVATDRKKLSSTQQVVSNTPAAKVRSRQKYT